MKPTVIQKPAAPGNYDFGRRNRINRITFHHIVGDASASIARFQTPGVEVSATYSIAADGTIYQHVDENNTPYSDGNADSNSRTISIEHAGGNPQVPYTEAMYASSIKLVAYLIQRYGITDFKRHWEVIDKTVYPGGTACPGKLDVERIVSKAKELLVTETHPYNAGDAVNIANDIGYPVETMKGKKDWNDAYYSSVGPYIRSLREELAQLRKTSCTADERQLLDLLKKVKE